MTILKVNMKLYDKIYENQNTNGYGGGAAPKAGTGEKRKYKKEKSARLDLWQSKCIAMEKFPPTPGVP